MNCSHTARESSGKGLLLIFSFSTEVQLGHCGRNTQEQGKAALHKHLRTEIAHLLRTVVSAKLENKVSQPSCKITAIVFLFYRHN